MAYNKYSYSNPYDDLSSKDKSVFNEGMLQIGRLDQSWRSCRICSRGDDFSGWIKEIDVIYRELYVDILKINPDIEKLYNKVMELAYKCFKIKETGLGKKETITNKKKLRFLLTKIETLLRQVQTESGKGGKYIDEQEDEFE